MSQQSPTMIGPYRITRELGRGKNTIVYKAQQTTLNNRAVALKVLQSHDEQTRQRFQEEARLSVGLSDTGVRRIYDAGRTPQGFPYVAMEYVDFSLKDWMQQRFKKKQPFSREEVYRLLSPVVQALETLHKRGVVHLDIKPDNILLTKDGHAMLADFGISRPRDTVTHAGTPRYMSPEQAAGDRPIGPWSDVYSLACVIYEMLTGRPPFLGDSDMILLRQHVEAKPEPPSRFKDVQIDPALERTLLDALSKEPKQRPQSARALLQALRGTSSKTRSRSLPIWIPVVLIILVGGSSLTAWWMHDTSTTPTPIPTTAQATTVIAPTPVDNASPTSYVEPTATAQVTATPAPEPNTPRPTTPIATRPQLLSPSKGSQLKNKVVTFSWEGSAAVNWQVHIVHWESKRTVTCKRETATSCVVDLPGDLFGEWHWWVQDASGSLKSEEWHLYLSTF